MQVSTLDAEIGGLTPRVVKIDVEGAELGVLQGGRGLLGQARPIVIFEHVKEAAALYGDAPDAVWELLGELDYEVFSATGEGPIGRLAFAENTSVVNWLAIPASQRGS